MNWKQPKVYAVKHKDEDIRAASRSGGIFTALSDLTLTNGGVVYGCVLTDEFTAVHIRAENIAERKSNARFKNTFKSKLGGYISKMLEKIWVLEKKCCFLEHLARWQV